MTDKTMTLEQVRDALRSIEGSKVGAFGGYYLSENAIKTWAESIDAHLRERESAKAGVTDALSAEDVVEKYPDYWQWETNRLSTFARGWNACRKAMLTAAPKPEKE